MKRTGWAGIGAGAVVLLVLILSSTGFFRQQPEDGIPILIGVSFSDLADPWQQQLYTDIQEAVRGTDAALLTYDAAGSGEEQAANLRELQIRRVDGVIAVPAQTPEMARVLKDYTAAGVPVVLVQTGVPAFEPDGFVYSDNRMAGEIAGSYISRVLGGRGVLMEIVGNPDDPVSTERKLGFRSKVAIFPELERAYLVPGHNSGTFAESALRDNGFLTADRLPDAVFAHTDLMAAGAARAFAQTAKKPLIVGINGLPGAMQGMDLVERGVLSATVSYPTGGRIAAEMLLKHMQDPTAPRETVQIQPVLHVGALSPR